MERIVLFDLCIMNIVSQSVICLTMCFDEEKFLILMKPNPSLFFCGKNLKVRRNLCLSQVNENIHKAIYNVGMGLFLDFLFCTTDLFVYSYANSILACTVQLIENLEANQGKIVLTFLGILAFYISLKIILSISTRKAFWIFIGFALNLQINLVTTDILMILNYNLLTLYSSPFIWFSLILSRNVYSFHKEVIYISH